MDQQLRRYHSRVPGGGHIAWYADPRAPLQPDLRQQIAQAPSRATKGGVAETHGKVVAELTFEFWRYVLDARHQPTLWAPALRHAFPHLRPRVRSAVYDPVELLHGLRNRVAHHEPVHSLPLAHRWEQLVRVASFVDPTTAVWIRSRSSVPILLATRP
jgi:hypothetical protein